MKAPYFSGKRLQILLHVIAWSIILFVPVFIFYTYGVGDFRSLGRFYTNAICYGIIFYINYIVLIPRFYFKEKKALYFISVLVLIAVMYLMLYQVDSYIFSKVARQPELSEAIKNYGDHRQGPRPPFKQLWIINFLFTSILISGFSFGLAVLDKLSLNEKMRKELEKEKLNSELAFLKNQVSPHFFFNTLNNIYALIGVDAPMAQQSVLNLSKLMRYLLYESEQGKTSMLHEIDFMKNYIDLMKLRLSSRVELKVSFPEEFPDFEFPPLLFIPFIENAFKHSVSFRGKSYIRISLKLHDDSILFDCSNSIGESSSPGDGQHSGIGLDNVRKRLNLLFPGFHKLDISENQGEFLVRLEINKLQLSA
jgi:two-component system, LytTR family, sensor kinase